MQDTPLAITAIGGDALLNTGTTDIVDIGRLTPGLRIEDSGPGQRRLSLRGILAAGEPTVGLYYDETPIAGNVGTGSDSGGRTPDLALFDVERIEVLRGPQGTLYGAGSMSGTIRVILNKPSFEVEGAAAATLSSTKGGGVNYDLNGMINLPIVADRLAARVVAFRRDSEGYIDNVRLGLKDINDAEAEGVRFLVRATPSPDLTIDASALIENTDSSGYSWDPDVGKYQSDDYVQFAYRDRSRIYNLTARWDVGPATLTGITSYQERDFTYTSGDDTAVVFARRAPANCASIFNDGEPCTDERQAEFQTYMDDLIPLAWQTPGSTENWTHELRLSSNGETWVDWTAGAYIEDRKNHVDSQTVHADPVTGLTGTPPDIVYHRYVDDHYEQVAGYADVTVKPLERLSLTVGARYFEYERTITGETDVPWSVLSAPIRPPWKVSTKENDWLLKFNGEYRFTPDIMVYALAAEGYRPGGANQTIGLPDALVAYGSDTLWNYELGFKSSFLDRAIGVNSAIFQIDWENMQVSGRTPDGFYSYITNVGSARVRGAELEVNVTPVRPLRLFANATYLDAKLTSDQANDFVVGAGRSGDRLPNIPHFTGTLGMEYEAGLSATLDFYARADVHYVGTSYSEFRPDNIYRVEVGDYALANMRVGIETADGRLGGYLFIDNAFDSTAITRAQRSAFGYSVSSARPRTIGVNARASF